MADQIYDPNHPAIRAADVLGQTVSGLKLCPGDALSALLGVYRYIAIQYPGLNKPCIECLQQVQDELRGLADARPANTHTH